LLDALLLSDRAPDPFLAASAIRQRAGQNR
jgi:hypothetical protein